MWPRVGFHVVPTIFAYFQVINKQSFFSCVWYRESSLVVQACTSSQTLVCQPRMFLVYFEVSCLCFWICGHKISCVVWSFHPVRVSSGDIPFFTVAFGVVRHERRILYLFSFSPCFFCFEQSTFKGIHKTFYLTIGMSVIVQWLNVCDATWPAEMMECLRCKL